jgi:prepilin-type N-terminal cleavage/methylation domain-containing protein
MLRREDGFTLMEMLVTIIVTGILFTAIMGSLASSLHWGSEVQERSVLQTEVRNTVDRLAAELRQAYTGDTTPLIEAAGPTALTFSSPDRGTPLRLRKLSYRLSNGTLERAAATSTNAGTPPWTFPALEAWIPQVGSVANTVLFSYATSAGAPTTDPALVKSVTITVSVATKEARTRQFTYRTSVTLRVAA